MSTPEHIFHLFPRLPAELRLAIWRECLPHRVSELDSPCGHVVFDFDSLSPCNLQQTTYLNGRPPAITHICHESRAVAFETGGFPVSSEERPIEARWASSTVVDSWRDPARDSVHLNWTPLCEPHYTSVGSPLHCLAWDAAAVPRGGSLMVDYLNYFSQTTSEMTDVLKRLPSWVVVMRVVVVHASPRTGAKTGLFGLLGDSRVQIVDVSDEVEVNAFFDVAEEYEHNGHATVRQDLHRDSAESIKQKLKGVIVEMFGSEERLPAMHPAIMFRLCTNMCNHLATGEDCVTAVTRQSGRRRGRERGRGVDRGRG